MLASTLALLGASMADPAGATAYAYALGQRRGVPDYVVRVPLPAARREVALPPVAGPQDPARPLVVIDAGHGGSDPGAVGAGGEQEKAIALSLARAVRDELLRQGRMRVALTRDADRFAALPERSSIARRLGADLFISIHASAAEAHGPQGASVHILAERASDREASELAARENAADGRVVKALAGTVAATQPLSSDLVRRRMLERSAVLARLIVREGRGRLRLRPAPLKRADLAILRPLEVPAVLFEAGNIAHPQSAASLASADGKASVAMTLARAISFYFQRLPPER